MQQIIHEELAKLQAELQTLETAVKQIAKAEEIATTVVNTVHAIQDNYQALLNEVGINYNLYLEQALSTHQHTLDAITESIEQKISQTQQKMQESIQEFTGEAHDIIEAYSVQAQKIQEYLATIPTQHKTHLEEVQSLFQEAISKIHQGINADIGILIAPLETTVMQFQKDMQIATQKFTTDAQTVVGAYSSSAKDIQAYLDNIPSRHESHLNKMQDVLLRMTGQTTQDIKTSIENFIQQSNGTVHAFQLKLQETKIFLDDSNLLIVQIQQLLERFKTYDIPQRMDKLDFAQIGIQQGIQNILMRTETLERNLLPKMDNLEKRMIREMQSAVTMLATKIEEQNWEIQELKKPWWAFFRKQKRRKL